MKIIMFNNVGSTNVSSSLCLYKKFFMSKIKYEEGNMNGEEDEEERMTMCFGNDKNKQK